MLNVRTIVAGVIGALLGFVFTMMLLGLLNFGNPMDPIMSGLIALAVLAPAGAIGGLVLGVKLAMRMQGQDKAAFIRNALAALGATVAASAVIGGGVIYYYVATATPWLNPNAANVVLQFEVRLPAGVALPASARDVRIELQTDVNTMPGELRELRQDGGRTVIVGKVDLAYRTAYR